MSTTDIGFNFRETSGFVTDEADETYDLGDVYPVTRDGWTFGWSVDMNARDRLDTIDRRLAGMIFQANDGTQALFRADLPAVGDYSIRLAIGDATTAQLYQYVQVRDGAAVLFTIDDSDGTASSTWDDAVGAIYTEITWMSGNTAAVATFGGTELNLALGAPLAQSGSSSISHLSISLSEQVIAPVRTRKLSTQQRMVA